MDQKEFNQFVLKIFYGAVRTKSCSIVSAILAPVFPDAPRMFACPAELFLSISDALTRLTRA
jgi:hypothetical protein